MSKQSKRKEALLYHSQPRPGKIQVVPTTKYATQRDYHWHTLLVWQSLALR